MKEFEPTGGYPPLIRLENKINESQIERRSVENKSIINIKNIIDAKKKNTFIKLGMNDEGGAEEIYDTLTLISPIEYDSFID